MCSFLVFAGTTEGRQLVELLQGYNCAVTACVATQYGGEVLPRLQGLTVLAGRLDRAQMVELFTQNAFDCVFDATHPYAAAVTQNIAEACAQTGMPYVRVLRAQSGGQNCTYVENTAAAAAYLGKTNGNVLITTGSKELDLFATVRGCHTRLYVRVLPAAGVVERCLALGFAAKNIICMQGPFSEELNYATLKQISAACLVTKDSGDAGGFAQKCSAAHRAGTQLVVIGRPVQAPDGLVMADLPALLQGRFGLQRCKRQPAFPLFVPIGGRAVVVVGGGRIAQRRVNTLLQFGCAIRVIAPSITETLAELAHSGAITVEMRSYARGDCAGAALAVAATDSRVCNHSVCEECAAAGIPVSVADCTDECSFYFPGIVTSGDVVVGVTASGGNHRLAKTVTENIRAQADSILKNGKGNTQ